LPLIPQGKLFKEDTIHRRKPGALHHLAFKAASCAEVDRLYLQIKETGANIVEEPKFFPQHGERYYALFFKDLEGIKYEIVYEERKENTTAWHQINKPVFY